MDENTLIFDPKEESKAFFYHGVQQARRDLLKKQNKEVECLFDQVFDFNTSNQEVFDGSTKDMIASLLDGYNCSVFAYGATGAGKTFTMLGNKECPGITYLTMSELYKQIDELKEDKDFELGISHLEVYNENVQDLIEPSGPLHLREDGNCGVLVAGLSVHRIQNAEELLALLERGNRNRTQHPTDANAESSRSHAVFQVYIRMTSKHSKQTKIVKLSMIDLAGSERGSATGCKGIRFTEGANINRSLLALGNCINNLADGLKHIPYRDSKLTRLLKDSLGGNCRTVMIANISPSSLSYEDTYNTLKYALRAKKIRSTLKKNIVSVQLHGARYAKVVAELSTEVECLKEKLKQYEKKVKEYESSNASNEVKPSTSKAVDPPVLKVPEKCKEFLALLETKRAMHREIWKLGKEVKTLKWRIKQKLNAARGLPGLSINALDMNKGMSRIKTSVSQFEGRAASIREKMKKALSDLKVQIEKEVVLSSELEQNGSLSIIAKDIELSKLTLEKEEKTIQIQHLQQLLSMQQMENEGQSKTIRELCTTLREYHLTLMGHDRMTFNMNSHYQKLVRMLEGVKAVSWQEDENNEDSACFLNMKDFCDLSVMSLDKETKHNEISSKIFEEISANFSKPFSLSSVLPSTCARSQTSQSSVPNDTITIMASSPVKDKIISQGPDSEMEIAFELPSNFQIAKLPGLNSTFLKSESENDYIPETVAKSPINPEVLNSTFEIQSPKRPTPPEVKPRVLSDHNRLQPNIRRPGVTNGGQPNLKKREGGTLSETSKVLCNKENREVFVKPKLPPAPRSLKPTTLKPNLAQNLSSIKLPLNKNIPKIQHIPRPLHNPVPVSPRYARTPQKQFKHDWRKMPADRRRSQSLRMKPYSTPSKSKTG